MGDGPWWSTFFDRAYVEAWEKDGAFDQTQDAAQGIVRLLGLSPGDRVLDVPCGFGRFAGPLHDQGIDVTGIDVSRDQVDLAERDHPGPTYLLGDMREPPSGPFDAVLNLFSSFGYFDDPADDRACLDAWFDVLRPGGQLVIETMHRDRLAWLHGQEFDGGGRQEVGETDWATGVRTSSVVVDGARRTFRMRLYTATELLGMVADAGFVDGRVFGGFDREPLDPSRRLVLVARRPG